MTDHDRAVRVDNVLEGCILDTIFAYRLPEALRRARMMLTGNQVRDPIVREAYTNFSERHKHV